MKKYGVVLEFDEELLDRDVETKWQYTIYEEIALFMNCAGFESKIKNNVFFTDHGAEHKMNILKKNFELKNPSLLKYVSKMYIIRLSDISEIVDFMQLRR